MSNVIIFLCLITFIILIDGHGMVMKPIARSSRWRYDRSLPANYNDVQLFCGGFKTQWMKNSGKCGLCGDNYADPKPRKHELGGGPVGTGTIVETYEQGGMMQVYVKITANHKGYFKFALCSVDEMKESEECFEKHQLTMGGTDKFYIGSNLRGMFSVDLQLPSDIVCNHCVLQWTYVAGNSWGVCEDGTGALGCGIQENFRTCSDISILPK